MKKQNLIVASLALFATFSTLKAQDAPSTAPSPAKASSDKPIWSVGISGVVVDDDGEATKNLFNVGDSWNFLPYPTRLNGEMLFNKNFAVEAAFTYNVYKAGKVVNSDTLGADHTFIAFDVNARYYIVSAEKQFNLYGAGGLGFTSRSALVDGKNTPTFNLGLGANVWIYKGLGLNVQTQAKFKLSSKSSSYMMHSLGLVYRFGTPAGTTGGSIKKPM